MSITKELQPHRVFYYFEQMCNIPHGSGNTDQISAWIVEQAKCMGLAHIQDDYGNVVIYKEATPGYENEPTVIIQGHMDMVAVCDQNLSIDMTKEGLKLKVFGDYLGAEGTSLGGDDGIAVACALAILEADDIPHPAIEVVVTANEEIGMLGADYLDASVLKGRRFLNLDNEEEGHILTGCAGGGRANFTIPIIRENPSVNQKNRSNTNSKTISVSISGCKGGHSGEEINKGRINPICALGRMFYELVNSREISEKNIEIRLISLDGGVADNAIPTEAELVIKAETDSPNTVLIVKEILEKIGNRIKAEFASPEPDMDIIVEEAFHESLELVPANLESTMKIASILKILPNGIQSMSFDVPTLVETSLSLGIAETSCNPGTMEYDTDSLVLQYAVRSSVESAKEALFDSLRAVADLTGCECEINSVYPGWKYRRDSALRDKAVQVYRQLYNTAPVVEAIHAGLECGFFAQKIDDLDCISIGPDMKDIHTSRERLSIPSVKRTYDFLCAILAEKDCKD